MSHLRNQENDDNHEVPVKYCKFCFGTEEDDSEMSFVHPCRCRGTIHWVHNRCLDMWFSKANSVQQVMCIQCQTRYQKRFTLKDYHDWLIPRLSLDRWSIFEMVMDFWITYRAVNAFTGMMDGTRGIFRGLVLCSMWKCFVASSRRFCYYGSLAIRCATSIFNVSIDDYDERREIKARLPTDMHWEQIAESSVLQ